MSAAATIFPFGQVLTAPLLHSFPIDIALATAEGGWLQFHGEANHDPADGPPAVTPNFLAAVKPLPDREYAEEVEVFSLTTALTDADGRLWERTHIVTIFDLWRTLARSGELHPLFDPPSRNPQLAHVGSVTHRVVLEPIETLSDQRSAHLLEILREHSPTNSPLERLLFRIRLKSFAARIGLLEERTTFPDRARGGFLHESELLFTVAMSGDLAPLAALEGTTAVLPARVTTLDQLGTVVCRRVRLDPGWSWPAAGRPRLGQAEVWRSALEEVNAGPLAHCPFEPNPTIRYVPALGR